MKKLLVPILAIAALLVPVVAQAATFVARDQYATGPADRITDGLYVASGMISIGSPVSGDLLAAGGQITVTGATNGNVEAVGGNVSVLGPVSGSVRVAGGQIVIGGHVTGDVAAAGGGVSILPGAVVDGDVYAAGGQVTIDGVVRGDVHASVGKKIVVGSAGRINGSLTYRAPQEVAVAAGGAVVGVTTYHQISHIAVNFHRPGAFFAGLVAFATAAKALALLGFAIAVVWFWRRWATEASQEVNDRFWPSVGHGLVYGILVPIAAILLLISLVGSMVGIIALLSYAVVLVVAKALAGVVFGAWLAKIIKRGSALHVSWLNAILGTLAFLLLTFIPIVGWIIQAVLCLAVFGVLAQRVQKMIV